MEYFDEKQVRKCIRMMKTDGQTFEIRIIGGKVPVSGYFRDVDTAIAELKKQNLKGCNVYMTLGNLNPACYSRSQKDKFMEYTKASTSDNDVIGYDWLMVDLDPTRPKDTSSSEEEIKQSKELADKIFHFMSQIGFEKPLVAMSGNGFHLMYRISLKNDASNRELLKDCLYVLDMLFSTEYCAIDVKNFNPGRVCKLYGTLAQKGCGTKERPHRMSYVYGSDELIKVSDKCYLEKLADQKPKDAEPRKYNNYNAKDFDLDEWLDKYLIRYRKVGYSDGDKYILDCCPFDSNHKGKDACLFKGRNGAIGFHCFHNSCAGKTWRDFRLLYEPDAYEKKQMENERRMYKSFNREKPKAEPIVENGEPIFYSPLDIINLPQQEETFVRTGIDVIDKKMRGLRRGDVSLWSGLRSSAKSTVLSEIGLNAINDGNNVGFYSGELRAKNFMRWLMLQCAGKSKVEPSQYEGYYNVPRATQEKIANWMNDKLFLYNNNYGHDYSAMRDQFQKLITEKKLDLLILDNLMSFNISDLSVDKWDCQKEFIFSLQKLAKENNVHICIVAHPRKAMGFLRLNDISGSADLGNAVDSAFIVHRNNNDFRRLTKEMFQWTDSEPIYMATNVIEIAKDRDGGTQDVFIPLWYELETKRLKNYQSENVIYGWDNDNGFEYADEETPFG